MLEILLYIYLAISVVIAIKYGRDQMRYNGSLSDSGESRIQGLKKLLFIGVFGGSIIITLLTWELVDDTFDLS